MQKNDLAGMEYVVLTSANDLSAQEFNSVRWSDGLSPAGSWAGTVEYGAGYVKLSQLHVSGSGGTVVLVR